MSESMIERVARAIEAELGHQEMVLTDPITLRRLVAKRVARAAIEAMREPTPAMYIAAYAANGGKWTSVEFEPPPKECWEAMIDAALSEKP